MFAARKAAAALDAEARPRGPRHDRLGIGAGPDQDGPAGREPRDELRDDSLPAAHRARRENRDGRKIVDVDRARDARFEHATACKPRRGERLAQERRLLRRRLGEHGRQPRTSDRERDPRVAIAAAEIEEHAFDRRGKQGGALERFSEVPLEERRRLRDGGQMEPIVRQRGPRARARRALARESFESAMPAACARSDDRARLGTARGPTVIPRLAPRLLDVDGEQSASAAGVMPSMRAARPSVSGRTTSSFSASSAGEPGEPRKAERSGILTRPDRRTRSATRRCRST